jgi:hypothetical protein
MGNIMDSQVLYGYLVMGVMGDYHGLSWEMVMGVMTCWTHGNGYLAY